MAVTYLVIWPGDGLLNHQLRDCDTKEDAIETVKSLLDDGTVSLDTIFVYKDERLKIALGIEE